MPKSEPKVTSAVLPDADLLNWLEQHCRMDWPFGNEVQVTADCFTLAEFQERPSLREAVSAAIQAERQTKPAGVELCVADFESACSVSLNGWLWDESFSPDHQRAMSLTICEMRYLANCLRAAQGLPPGVVQSFDEKAVVRPALLA